MKYLYLLLCFTIIPQIAFAEEKPEQWWNLNNKKITRPSVVYKNSQRSLIVYTPLRRKVYEEPEWQKSQQPKPPLILDSASYEYRVLRSRYMKSNSYYQIYKSQILHQNHFCTCEKCCPPIRLNSTGVELPPPPISGFHFYLRL